jgi:Flp pilus assembly protein TadG
MPVTRPFSFKRFARADRGAVAMETGLVLMPMLLLTFALIELAMSLLAFSTLENANQIAARRIRTGEFQLGTSHSKTDFKALVCANMSWLAAQCVSDSYVDVRTYSSFSGLGGASPQGGAAFNPNTTCFSPGNPTDIVLVRTYFKWRLFTPFLDTAMENMGKGSGLRLMSTATAFRNEPYNDTAALGAKC